MEEAEFLARFEREIPIFHAWGLFVQNTIVDALKDHNDVDTFLKIPPEEPRIKSSDSILAKAYHRNKNYASPYDEITDKVGIRFVVLLTTNTSIISDIVDSFNNNLWVASRDKDFEEQREKDPEHFTYESIHYVVTNKEERTYNAITIPINVPCEIQIRTLLQHAYAEMSHDTIYKSQVKADPLVKRYMARSMALVESADWFFIESMKEIDKKSRQHEKWNILCLEYYPKELSDAIDFNANTILIDKLIPFLKGATMEHVRQYLDKNIKTLSVTICSKQKISWIYRQPAVLLVYYLIKYHNIVLQQGWDLDEKVLRLLLSDMGVAPIN